MHTHYTAKVYGITWTGAKASTEYRFGFADKPTRDQIMSRANYEDFKQVTRIYLTSHVVTVTREKLL